MPIIYKFILLILVLFSTNTFSFNEPSVVRFKNGATLVMVNDPSAKINSAYVFVRTGSLFETPWIGSGLSHFLEHLVSGGTTEFRGENEYKEMIDAMGGASNAYTTYDHTAYYIKSSPQNTALALNVLFEWMNYSNWTEREYNREKGVVLKEMSRADNNVQRQIYYQVQSRFYKDSPYRYPVIGYRDQFNSVSSQELKRYYQMNYVPENFVIVVGGRISENVIINNVEKSFGDLPALAAPLRYHSDQKRILSPVIEHIYLPSIKTNRIVIRYPIPSFHHQDVYPLDLFAFILGNGEQSLLYQYLVTEQKLATSVSVNSITPMADYGYFEISLETDQNVDLIVKEVQSFLDKYRWKRLPKAIMKKAMTQKKNEYLLDNQSLDSYVNEVGRAMMMGQNPLFFDYYSTNFNYINQTDIIDVVQKYLVPSKRHVYQFSSKMERQFNANSSVPDDVSVIVKDGLSIMLIPESNKHLFKVSLLLKGGITEELKSESGIGTLASMLIGKRTVSLDRKSFQDQFETKGAKISGALSHNYLQVNLTSTVSDARQLLPLFFDSVINFDSDPDTFSETKNKLIKSIIKTDESWFDDSFIKLKSIVFKESSPFSRPLKGTVETVKELQLNDVKLYLNQRLSSSSAMIIIQTNKPADYVAQVLGLYPFRNEIKVAKSKQLSSIYTAKKLNKSELKQPVGVVLKMTPLKKSYASVKEWLKVQLVDAILSGVRYPSGLLHSRLRGQQLVYVVHTVPVTFGSYDSLFTYALTESKEVDIVNKIISQSFKEIRTDITPQQLDLAKAQVLFNIQSSLQDANTRSRQFYLYWDYFNRFPTELEIIETLNSITISDIKETVNEAFLPSRTVLFNAEKDKNR